MVTLQWHRPTEPTGPRHHNARTTCVSGGRVDDAALDATCRQPGVNAACLLVTPLERRSTKKAAAASEIATARQNELPATSCRALRWRSVVCL